MLLFTLSLSKLLQLIVQNSFLYFSNCTIECLVKSDGAHSNRINVCVLLLIKHTFEKFVYLFIGTLRNFNWVFVEAIIWYWTLTTGGLINVT